MKTPVRISASQLVLKKTITPPVVNTPIPKVSFPSSSVTVESIPQASMDLSVKSVSPTKSSIPWTPILIGATALVIVGVILYQIEKRRREADERSY
ncbi:hypothetical protein N9355_08130 [Crocinitomicaceae bacterium]|nr:hypothetical protein [Crocinitomicaceae bacterium]